jgi:hypothetical protein
MTRKITTNFPAGVSFDISKLLSFGSGFRV